MRMHRFFAAILSQMDLCNVDTGEACVFFVINYEIIYYQIYR